MKKDEMYSLQGIIFQQGHAFGIGHKPGIGAAVRIEKAFNYGMFHAVVGPSEENSEELCGHMNDRWGQSKITNFQISEEGVSFTKWYTNRPPIDYVLSNKKENIWIGTWEGEDCGTGVCKCIVNEIDESFFNPVA